MVLRVIRWTLVVCAAAMTALVIVAGARSTTTTLRTAIVETLEQRLESEVELAAFDVSLVPAVRITGEGLVIRHKGRRDVPPLVSIRRFALSGGLIDLMRTPRRFRTVTLSGLQLNIPPGGLQKSDPQLPGVGSGDGGGPAAIFVDRLIADDATLTIIPRRAGKEPKVFAVHRLAMRWIGRGDPMPFEAALINPVPKGTVKTTGTFGPWRKDDPGDTPLGGTYTFENADLSTIKGIGGTLRSAGSFGGTLDRIGVTGETDTPDFRVDVAGNPVPLHTRFDAVVDGTDGDTYLNEVNATFLRTTLGARGKVVGAHGVKGRTVQLHVLIERGRIEDVLRLAVKGSSPVLTGGLALHADMNLPAGPADVIDRLDVSGRFDVGGARFNDAGVRQKLAGMSQRALGEDPDEAPASVVSDLQGRFRLAGGRLILPDATFGIPGANIQIAGVYGLENETLAFDGTLRMKATISQAAGGGLKSFFLKIVDPFFRKKGAGTVLPIRIRGTREHPKFGVDMGKALTPR
jgi:hypothetical protein